METFQNHTSPGAATELEEIERLQQERDEARDRYLRTLAEFDNYRRRMERERATFAETGKREILLSLLDVVDTFDRALDQTTDMPTSVAEGLEALHRQLIRVLEEQGVTPVDSVGQLFDPTVHEALGTIAGDKDESGTIVCQQRRGYRWGDQLLRAAQVYVAG